MNKYNLLEFDKLKDIIENYCYSKHAKEKIKNLSPYRNKSKILNSLSLISEMKQIADNFNFSGFSNILPLLNANKQDTIFTYEDFKKINKNIHISSLLIKQKKNLSDYGNLKKIIDKLFELSFLTEDFYMIFDNKGNVKDTASKKLYQIRSSQKSVRKNILKILENELRDLSANNYVSDNIITQRSNRYVIPIKKNSVPFVNGMVLDSSSSGFSAFVEPAKVISLNNSLKLLIDDEKYEIHRIFEDYTKKILDYRAELETNHKILTELDFYQGIARFANDYNANIPLISEEKKIELKDAKHPLLIKYYQDASKVIPFDLKLGHDKRIMILSGPNTGGKTVTLKTVGLLTLMALSGLPITAKENSVIGMFYEIYADIGDSQSIDESLSTFSSHINNVKKMLENGDRNSLILIDEIGSSTDPEQGTALAYAILEKIIRIGATAIITTHYTALKLFAEEHFDCFNASMVFDPQNHIPTYHLQKGIPGNSFALEIAESLGFPKDIIERAKELLGKQNMDLSKILKKLSEERKHLSQEIYKFQLRNALYQKKIEEYENKIQLLEKEANEKKEKLIAKTKEHLYNIQREIANELEKLKKEDKKNKKKLEQIFEKVVKQNNSIRKKNTKKENVKLLTEPTIGMRVWIKDIEQEGEICEIDNKGIKVDIQGMYYTTHLENLMLIQGETKEIKKHKIFPNKTPKTEINLVGNTFEEAFPKLLAFLDDAYLIGLKKVRIIHGKGTGALRFKIRNYLKSDSRVKKFESASIQFGGNGVTEVEFADDQN